LYCLVLRLVKSTTYRARRSVSPSVSSRPDNVRVDSGARNDLRPSLRVNCLNDPRQ
jgi:hypothetical protein